jgi:Fe2+ or Zn2+ uptake regulation protein
VAVFDDPMIETAVLHAATQTGYSIDQHRVELFGRCRPCQDTPRDEAKHEDSRPSAAHRV